MNKFFGRKTIVILLITTIVLVCFSVLLFLFVYNNIETYLEEDYTFAEDSRNLNSDRIYTALSDLEKAIFIDKYLVLWNDDTFLRKSYTLQGQIYNSLKTPNPQKALEAFYNCGQLIQRTDDYDQKEYLDLEYMIALCYKNMNDEKNAREHFNNTVEGYRKLYQEKAEQSIDDYQYFLRAYVFLAASDYELENYELAFNEFSLSHGAILELTDWEFSSYRYNKVYSPLLIICSDYAAKSAEIKGNESQKINFERHYEIYKYLLDYDEDDLQQLYSLAFSNIEYK